VSFTVGAGEPVSRSPVSLADRIFVMNRGRIEQRGAPDDFYMRPETVFVASFSANWFHGRVSKLTSGSLSAPIINAGTRLPICERGNAVGASLSLCVRPERITVARADAFANPERVRCPAG
jgi:spermidine/putrescine transport system ATP-binding protein